MSDVCSGRATPGDHFWGPPKYYHALGIEVKVEQCMMCGKSRTKLRQLILGPDDSLTWSEAEASDGSLPGAEEIGHDNRT